MLTSLLYMYVVEFLDFWKIYVTLGLEITVSFNLIYVVHKVLLRFAFKRCIGKFNENKA